jgi:hypothetical protein
MIFQPVRSDDSEPIYCVEKNSAFQADLRFLLIFLVQKKECVNRRGFADSLSATVYSTLLFVSEKGQQSKCLKRTSTKWQDTVVL